MRLDQAARGVFLWEFVSAFFLGMRYFFKAKPTLDYDSRFSVKEWTGDDFVAAVYASLGT